MNHNYMLNKINRFVVFERLNSNKRRIPIHVGDSENQHDITYLIDNFLGINFCMC